MADSLTLAAFTSITGMVNAAASAAAGQHLPPASWMWNCHSAGSSDPLTAEFLGTVDPELTADAATVVLGVWAQALGMTEATTDKEQREGCSAYTGMLAGSRIRLTAATVRAHADPQSTDRACTAGLNADVRGLGGDRSR